jgi:hypothetical protein
MPQYGAAQNPTYPAPKPPPPPRTAQSNLQGAPPIVLGHAPAPSPAQHQQVAYHAAPHNYGPASPAALPPTPRPNPGSDIQSSGAGYGSAQANAFKQTQAYRQAVIDTFLHQSKGQATAIVRGALTAPSYEGSVVLHYLRSQGLTGTVGGVKLSNPFAGDVNLGSTITKGVGSLLAPHSDLGKLTAKIGGPTSPVGALRTGADTGLKGASDFLTSIHAQGSQPAGQLSNEGFGAGGVGNVVVKAPVDIARAAIQDPSVIPKTVKGLGETAVGSVAALAQLPINAIQQGPGKAISQLAQSVGANYSQRYGPLYNGNDQAFINQIKQQGAGAELLDALGVAGGLDATIGRAATDVGKTAAKLSGKENFLTRARPALRISGGETRAQQLARGAGKITMQRAEDRLRRAAAQAKPRQVPPRPGEVSPIFASRAARVHVSTISTKYRQLMQSQLTRQVRQGAEKGARKLSPVELRAMPFALERWFEIRQGPAAIRAAIDKRIAMIRADRQAGGDLNPGNRIPAQIASKVDEIHLLTQLRANVEKWATPRLANYVDQEAARSAALEHNLPSSYLHAGTAEARRLRPQGEFLGVEHPDVTAARAEAAHAKAQEVSALGAHPNVVTSFRSELNRSRNISEAKAAAAKFGHSPAVHQEVRPALLHDYVQQVRAAARKQGLGEPAFIKHQANPRTDFGAYTSGQGARAMTGPQQSHFVNWHAGVVDRSPQAYFDSLAKSIKGSHQWKLVDEQFRRSALPTPTKAAAKAALGKNVHPADLTLHELRQVLLHQGVDLAHVRFYNPGRLAETTLAEHGLVKGSRAGSVPHELTTSPELHTALQQRDVSLDGAKNIDEQYLRTPGWKAIPKNAYDEIHSSLQPSGLPGRLVGKAQGLTAGAILGLSPSFVIMNTLAHVYLAAFGTRGRMLTDAAKFPLWWHGLSDAQRDLVRAHAGGRGMHQVERLGSTAPTGLAASWDSLRRSGIGRVIGAVNPMHVLFKAEDLQSNFFRHMVYYSAAKRQALENITHDLGPAAAAAQRLNHVLTTGPKNEMARLIASQSDAEHLGRYTVNMMGDYARYTNRERKYLNNRAVLFYSFLRHATRTLLYVLPVHHPIATALVGEMAQLHNDEVKKLLGGQDMPWANSRVFFNKNGKLTSVDLMRASPIGAAAVDVASGGITRAASLIAPELQPFLNMIYKQDPSGAPYKGNAFSALNSFLSMSYPYRLARDLHFGTKQQQSDSIPLLHERPAVKQTKAAQAYQAAKEQASGPLDQKILAGLLGLVPKPDDSGVIAAHKLSGELSKARGAVKKVQKAAKQSGAGGGGYLLGGGGASGSASGGSTKSGYLLGGGGSTTQSGSGSGYLLP